MSGRVTGPRGKRPVPGVDAIFATRRGAESTATSDKAGEYSLRLGAGSYRVRAVGDRVMAFGLPPLTIAQTARRYDIRVRQHSIVRGHVRHANGTVAAGAFVVPQLAGGSPSLAAARGELGNAEVQRDGSFELFTVHGNLRLNASSGSAAGTTLVRALEPGEVRRGVTIVLVANGYVSGVVRGPKGKAVGGAKVLVSMQIPGTGEYDRVPVTADTGGLFRFQVLRPGHTIVEATAPGFAQSAPIAFRLAAGKGRKGIVLTLHKAVLSLQGHVFDDAGTPLPFVQVAQGQMGSKERFKKTYTNEHGYFTIDGLGPGPHRLRFNKLGYKQVRVPNYTAPRSDIRVLMSRKR